MKKVLFLAIPILLSACGGTEQLPATAYYNYDRELPLEISFSETPGYGASERYAVEFGSVHDKRVTGLLDLPTGDTAPYPVVILLHGLGDRKEVDYIEAGVPFFLEAGYAVMRIDVSNHGSRKEQDFDFSFTGPTKYRSREVVTQTVFDLRRTVDFLETRPEIDTDRIGYYGISLGGIIGTVFCSIDQRVGAVVIALAGGGLNFMFGMNAISEKVRNYLSIIDPVNFVAGISPRPLLMINAEQDEIVPPVMSRLLYTMAEDPKNIIWYPTKHRSLPVEEAYPDGVQWFDKYMK